MKSPMSRGQRGTKNTNYRHGYNGTPTYVTYTAMKGRCLNPNFSVYHHYGGRGIKICDRWLSSFENFLEDMGERPEGMTLERIDTEGNYEPDNCTWATKFEQARNHRMLKNNISGVKGVGYEKRAQKWRARIGHFGNVIALGYFDTIEEATNARLAAESVYWLVGNGDNKKPKKEKK